MYFLRPSSLFPAACRVSRSLHCKGHVKSRVREDLIRSRRTETYESESSELFSELQVFSTVELLLFPVSAVCYCIAKGDAQLTSEGGIPTTLSSCAMNQQVLQVNLVVSIPN